MGWLDWLDGRPKAEQQSLMPGDIGYLCNGCGQSLTGGFLGMGHCRCCW